MPYTRKPPMKGRKRKPMVGNTRASKGRVREGDSSITFRKPAKGRSNKGYRLF